MKHNLSNEQLRAQMDEEARAAEAAAYDDVDDGAPLPPHVKVSRPNRARSRVLQVRLNPEEFEAIEAIAARRELPASTVAREWLLQMIREDQGPLPDAAALAGQLADVAGRMLRLAEIFERPGQHQALTSLVPWQDEEPPIS